MGGLNLGLGGSMRVGGGGLNLGSSLKQPQATIAQTAYGAQVSPTDQYSGGVQSWHLMIAVPILGAGFLAFLRWSLPK